MSTVSRRTKKWHPTPPPPASPKIHRSPRRRRTHLPKNNPLLIMNRENDPYYKGDLENMFYHELLNSSVERRERVKEREDEEDEVCERLSEEKLLRMEKNRRRKKIMQGKNEKDLAEELEKNPIPKDSEEAEPREEKCSGRCRAIVARMAKQVRSETEQWLQMQKMLEKVRAEMEELQATRDHWERLAHDAGHQTRSLRHAVGEWRERALDYGRQVDELRLKLSYVKQKKKKKAGEDRDDVEGDEETTVPPLSLAKQIAKEKRSLTIRSLKENRDD